MSIATATANNLPRPALRIRSQTEQPQKNGKSALRSVSWFDEGEKARDLRFTYRAPSSRSEMKHGDTRKPPVLELQSPTLKLQPTLAAGVVTSLQDKRTPQPSPKSGGSHGNESRILYSTPHPVPRNSCYQAAGILLTPTQPTGSGYSSGAGRSSFSRSPPPLTFSSGFSRRSTCPPTSLFPSVVAAAEALRINLGLDNGMNSTPYRPAALQAVPMSTKQTLSGTSQVSLKSNADPATQLLCSLYPAPGQTQPSFCQSDSLPPIVNTGSSGLMKVQPGDWSCLVCSFVNWRRRKYCMRCCPFADGNAAGRTSPPQTVPSSSGTFGYSCGLQTSPLSLPSSTPMQAMGEASPYPASGSSPFSLANFGLYGSPRYPLQLAMPTSVPARGNLNAGQLLSSESLVHLPFMGGNYGGYPMYLPQMPLLATALPQLPLPSGLGAPFPLGMPLNARVPATVTERPLTPSPTSSDGSACSFGFSSTESHSPRTPSTSASPQTPLANFPTCTSIKAEGLGTPALDGVSSDTPEADSVTLRA